MRITRKDVNGMFERYIKMLGYKPAESRLEVGAWRLDYVGLYGGFVIERVENEAGGISNPFGSNRRNTREMYYTLYFAIRAFEYQKYVEKAPLAP